MGRNDGRDNVRPKPKGGTAGQSRDALGRLGASLTRVLPAPSDSVSAILTHRAETLALGKNWRPTLDQWETLSREVLIRWRLGESCLDQAERMGVPEQTVRRALSHARTSNPETPEAVRQWGMTMLEVVLEKALASDDLEAARKTIADIGRFAGVVTAPVPVASNTLNVSMTSAELTSDIRKWMAERSEPAGELAPKTIDAEEVDGE